LPQLELNSESELIIKAQNGCISSFEQLIQKIDKKMLSLAAGLATTHDEAEDIYQEAMLTAYKGLPKFKMQSQFSTWLYRIVVNTAISSRRKLRNKINTLIYGHSQGNRVDQENGNNWESYESYAVGGEIEEPDSIMINQQLSEAITRSLSDLSEKERIAFVLCHQQELKIIDAAHIMQCSDGAIKNYLFRARQKMKAALKDYI
jgi:RNA polymerase sigma-70 factor (ECF subfamily)